MIVYKKIFYNTHVDFIRPVIAKLVESVGVCTKITSILWLIVINLQAIIFTNS